MVRGSDGSRARRVWFIVLCLVLGAFGASAVPTLVTGWTEGGDRFVHRVHDIGTGLLFTILFGLPLILAPWGPERRIAAIQQAIAVAVGIAVALVLALDLGLDQLLFTLPAWVVLGIAAWLHPARHRLLRAGPAPSSVLGLLTLAAAVPVGWYAWHMATFQRIGLGGDPHVEEHHWSTMAALAVALVLVGAVGAARAPGWRIPAWSAAASAVVFGVASVAFPAHPGSLGTAWGVAAIAGGALYAFAAETIERRSVARSAARVG